MGLVFVVFFYFYTTIGTAFIGVGAHLLAAQYLGNVAALVVSVPVAALVLWSGMRGLDWSMRNIGLPPRK